MWSVYNNNYTNYYTNYSNYTNYTLEYTKGTLLTRLGKARLDQINIAAAKQRWFGDKFVNCVITEKKSSWLEWMKGEN